MLEVRSGNIPNTIATVLLKIRDLTGVVPDIYFEWTEGNPISNMFRFLVTGAGEVAPVTREVLRRAEHDPRAPARRARELTLSRRRSCGGDQNRRRNGSGFRIRISSSSGTSDVRAG